MKELPIKKENIEETYHTSNVNSIKTEKEPSNSPSKEKKALVEKDSRIINWYKL